jgi:hypothetical protein
MAAFSSSGSFKASKGWQDMGKANTVHVIVVALRLPRVYDVLINFSTPSDINNVNSASAQHTGNQGPRPDIKQRLPVWRHPPQSRTIKDRGLFGEGPPS